MEEKFIEQGFIEPDEICPGDWVICVDVAKCGCGAPPPSDEVPGLSLGEIHHVIRVDERHKWDSGQYDRRVVVARPHGFSDTFMERRFRKLTGPDLEQAVANAEDYYARR